MKKQIRTYFGSLFLLFVLVLSFTNGTAQILHSESFDNATFLPTGWAGVGSISSWSRRTVGTFPTCTTNSGVGMARFNSRTATVGTQQTISTPVIDLSNIGTDTSTFILWIYRNDSLTADSDRISIYINNTRSLTGATMFGQIARSILINMPDTQAVSGWYQYKFDLPAGFNTDTNYILIQGTTASGNGTGFNIFIDDVQWESFPVICTGTPAPGAITASSSLICGGSGSTLLTLQGADSIAGVSYQWRSAPSDTGPWTDFGTSVKSINSGTLTATTYFQVLVTCSFSGLSDSTAVDSVVVSLAPLPNVVATPTAATYCLLTNVPVMLTASGGVSYTWSPATGLNSVVGDTVYAIDSTTVTYTITGFDSIGCSDTAHVVVTPHNTPVVTGTASATNFCLGDSVTLSATSQLGSVTYIWYPGADTSATITVLPDTSTVYTVVAISLYGCSGTQSVDTASVNVVLPAVASFTDSITNRTVTFTNTSTGGTGYIWYFGDGNASFQSDPTYTYTSDGTDTVMLIVLNGNCPPDTFIQVITVFTVGITEAGNIHTISVLQNSEMDKATILFYSDQPKAILQVINSVGQVVLERTIVSKGNKDFKEEIDMTGFTSGVYSIHIINSSADFSRKLVKL
jgi:hypothetical protein